MKMWKEFYLEVDRKLVKVCMKQFEEGSEFGIDNGRISILDVRFKKDLIISYSRGWDIKPKTDFEKKVLDKILKLYN